VYDIRDEDKAYATMTPFCTNEFLLRRRKGPKVAMNNRLIADNTTSTSMRITVFSQRYFAQSDKVLHNYTSFYKPK
jgi:hypothetical protein